MLFNYIKSRIRKKKLAHYQKIDGWLTENEAEGLFEIARLLPEDSIVLEIGSWKGKSTWCIAQGLKKGGINCIDPFNAYGEQGSRELYEKTKGNESLLEQFYANLKGISSNVKVIVHKGYSKAFVGKIRNIDFLFIDGDHSIEGCDFDFENFAIELRVGGYLAFHDYYPDRKDLGPTWVIENRVKSNKMYRFFKTRDSLCIFQKIQ